MEITVHSVIENLDDTGLIDGEPEINVTTKEAFVNTVGDTTVIRYTEDSEGGSIQTKLTVKDGSVHLLRTGAIEWSVLFDEGSRMTTVYKIPPYAFDCEVETKRVRIKTDGLLELRLVYSMNIGGGKKNVRMRITLCGN